MSEENLFDPSVTPEDQNQPKPTVVPIPDNVKELVGPGKKYATVEKALEALGHSQEHIARLEAEARELRERNESALSNEKVYETVQELLKQDRETHGTSTLDEATLAQMLDRQLTQREQAAVARNNLTSVQEALVSKFGDAEKAEEAFQNKAKELGVGAGFLKSMAEKSPKAALELLGLKPSAAPSTTPSRGTVNTEALSHVKHEQAPKSVMGGATSSEIMAAWRSAAPKSN